MPVLLLFWVGDRKAMLLPFWLRALSPAAASYLHPTKSMSSSGLLGYYSIPLATKTILVVGYL